MTQKTISCLYPSHKKEGVRQEVKLVEVSGLNHLVFGDAVSVC